MKIALIHDWLTGMRGGEKCLEIICRRFPQAGLFTLLHRRGSVSPTIERMSITTSFLQWLPAASHYYRYLLPAMPTAVEALRLPPDLDLVLSFSHAVAGRVIAPPGVPHVCYCFTPMRYAWQLRDEYLPPSAAAGPFAVGKRAVRWAQHRLLDRIRNWDLQTSGRVTHFVAISRTIQGRIRDCYSRESVVIAPPVDTRFYTPNDTPREDFYCVVSALVPYKRIDLAIAACQALGRRLVVIGSGPEQERLSRMGDGRVEWLGWRSNEEIRDYLRRCRAFLFPGEEDFGITPLEAQACGTPVIALRRGGATETLLEADERRAGSGFFFDQPTAADLAAAIERFESQPQAFSPALARRQALGYSAELFEQKLIAYLSAVLAERSPQTPAQRFAA